VCSILLDAAATFALCLCVHVTWWRIRRPTAYRQWLPALVAIFLVAGPAAAWLVIRSGALAIDAPHVDAATEWAATLLLHGAASAVYIIGYTLVSAFSPSIEILKLLDRRPGGVPRAAIDLPYLRTALGSDRVSNLLSGGMIRADGDHVRLGPEAQALTRLVLFYRHAIGLPDGAGG
jgi:hypothetical protein